MTRIMTRKAALQARLKDLQGRIGAIGQELESHQAQDWEDQAIEREDDQVLEGMGRSAQAEARAINAALARIASGEYGFCAKCGNEISDERLDLLPYTPFCKDCAP
jgi:RNA polymerase-binding transcription factor DksA